MSTITEYLEELSGRSVTVIGMGISNVPLIKMLLRAGVKVTVRDKANREKVADLAQELESLGVAVNEQRIRVSYPDDLLESLGQADDSDTVLKAELEYGLIGKGELTLAAVYYNQLRQVVGRLL